MEAAASGSVRSSRSGAAAEQCSVFGLVFPLSLSLELFVRFEHGPEQHPEMRVDGFEPIDVYALDVLLEVRVRLEQVHGIEVAHAHSGAIAVVAIELARLQQTLHTVQLPA